MKGIEETRDVIQALGELGAALRRVAADGIQITDGVVIVTDAELRGALVEAYQGATEIPAEVADLSFAEIGELMQETVTAVARIVNG